jgi:excisionase family DNA binding protein
MKSEPFYLDLKAAAVYCSISVRTLRAKIKAPGGPPFYRLSRKILLKRADLDAWLERHKVDLDEIAAQVLDDLR